MKKAILLLSFIASVSFARAQSNELKDITIKLSYFFAFGTTPAQAELTYWMGQPAQSLNQYIANHKQFLAGNQQYKETAIRRSYLYSFGRAPQAAETQYWAGQNKTFDELNKNHATWLASQPNEWKKVIISAYLFVHNQAPTLAEFEGWKKQTPIVFNDLVDILENRKSSRPRTYSVMSTDGVSRPNVSRSVSYLGSTKVSYIQ